MILFIRYALMALVVYFVYKKIKQMLAYSSAHQQSRHNYNTSESRSASNNPYDILGVPRGATKSEIKKAYHHLLAQYHPDKVAHLGRELQELAKEKTQKITKAYKQIS